MTPELITSNIIYLSPNETYLKVLKIYKWSFAYIKNGFKYGYCLKSAKDVVHHLLAVKFNRHRRQPHSTKPVYPSFRPF